MTHAWKQSIDIDEHKAQQLIASQFHLSIESICLFDEGWDNLVYLINNTLTFRFPRREFGVNCMKNGDGSKGLNTHADLAVLTHT